MKGYKRILLILFTFMYGCIEPIDLNIIEEKRILVVEGFVSTGPGPHRIKLTKSAKFGDIFSGFIRAEEGAEVWIRSNNGNVTVLTEENPGTYITPLGWHAELNKSYTLNITTSTGTHYTSIPETVVPVTPIDSLILQYKKIPTSDPATFITGFEVFARFQDPPDSKNFYTWRNNGTFLIETRPELHTVRNVNNPSVPIPAPKDCCAECWVNELNADFSVKILDDKNSNGTVNTVLAAFLPDNGIRFRTRYMIVIHQLSISREAHAFFDLLNKQLSIEGDIFDPPPATIRGNMINLDHGEENVIGYFYASDVSIDTVFISPNLLEDSQEANPKVINDDCRVLPLSTIYRPDYWE